MKWLLCVDLMHPGVGKGGNADKFSLKSFAVGTHVYNIGQPFEKFCTMLLSWIFVTGRLKT